MNTRERRSVGARGSNISVRSVNGKRTLSGYAVVFSPAVSEDLGGFIESIDSNAIDLSKQKNVFVLRGHDANKQLASTASKTLTLRKDSRGIFFEFDLPQTQDGDDLAELYKAGQSLGGQCSFGFIALSDDWTLRDNMPHRLVTSLELLEISVGVIFPAYADSSAALRSMPASMRELIKRDESEEETCSCRCANCVDDRCDQCDMDECSDDECESCQMQDTDSERALLLSILRRRRT